MRHEIAEHRATAGDTAPTNGPARVVAGSRGLQSGSNEAAPGSHTPGVPTALVLGLSAAALHALTQAALRPVPSRVDHDLLRLVQRQQSPAFTRLMTLVSAPGFTPLQQALTMGTALDFWAMGQRREAAFVGLTSGVDIITTLFKGAIGRARPDQSYRRGTVQLRDMSFPSGHCAHYAAFYGFLYDLAQRCMPASPLRTLIQMTCMALIVLVGPSRVYLGHHWPSDALAGALIGFTYLFVLIQLYERGEPSLQDDPPIRTLQPV